MEIPLLRGGVAMIDDSDAELVADRIWYEWKAPGHTYPYAVSWDKAARRPVYMHRIIMGATPGQMIDHENRNGLDNRRTNLRLCSRSQNNANSRASNKTGFRGVRFDPKAKKYRAEIKANRRYQYLGTFAEIEQAAIAYDAAARSNHGRFATQNYPGLLDSVESSISEIRQAGFDVRVMEQDHTTGLAIYALFLDGVEVHCP